MPVFAKTPIPMGNELMSQLEVLTFPDKPSDPCVSPHFIQAEQSLLGGLMLDNETWDNVVDKVFRGDQVLGQRGPTLRCSGPGGGPGAQWATRGHRESPLSRLPGQGGAQEARER